MKRMLQIGIMIFALAAVKPALAQDPLIVGPHVYKLILENDSVRVLEVNFKPGDSIGMHSHPDHAVYAVTDGQLTLTRMDGASEAYDIKAGDALWIPAESHSAINTGTADVKLVVVEIKGDEVITDAMQANAVPNKN